MRTAPRAQRQHFRIEKKAALARRLLKSLLAEVLAPAVTLAPWSRDERRRFHQSKGPSNNEDFERLLTVVRGMETGGMSVAAGYVLNAPTNRRDLLLSETEDVTATRSYAGGSTDGLV